MAEKNKNRTHHAYTLKREGRRLRQGRWLQIGSARQEDDGIMHLFLDTLPIGGFSGTFISHRLANSRPFSSRRRNGPG